VISRIAIVNRGEAAMRLIHAVRELNAETGRGAERRAGAEAPPFETVALHFAMNHLASS
jgi:biotin carboxylase